MKNKKRKFKNDFYEKDPIQPEVNIYILSGLYIIAIIVLVIGVIING